MSFNKLYWTLINSAVNSAATRMNEPQNPSTANRTMPNTSRPSSLKIDGGKKSIELTVKPTATFEIKAPFASAGGLTFDGEYLWISAQSVRDAASC